MKSSISVGTILLGMLLAPACRAAGWSNAEALNAVSVEMLLDDDARPLEVEYHVAPEEVPETVRAAMDALHVGGRVVAAEKEYLDGELFWELTKEIDGREVEAMFRPDGMLHSEELEISAAGVPGAVQDAVRARLDGEVTKWEEIRDAERLLVEYHAKLTADGFKYKIRVSTDAIVLGVLREVPAEIEIPVP